MTKAERLERVPIEKLVPYDRNARTHSKEQLEKLRASLREFGFVNPVLIDKDYNVIAGHGRLLAAREEGLTEVPCVFIEGLTETQRKAYILADNRMALDAGWDDGLLKKELEELRGGGFDDLLTGFSDFELDGILNEKKAAYDDGFDVVAEMERPAFSRPGDIWTLGPHRIACSEATTETVRALMGQRKADLVICDVTAVRSLEGLLRLDTAAAAGMKNDASVYQFHRGEQSRRVYDAFEESGFKVGSGLIWRKSAVDGESDTWQPVSTPIVFGWKARGRHRWYGDQRQTALFDFPGTDSRKPPELLAYLMRQSTLTGGIVLDPAFGTAEVLVAADETNRIFYGLDREPKHIDVAVRRYIALHGGDASGVQVQRDGEVCDARGAGALED